MLYLLVTLFTLSFVVTHLTAENGGKKPFAPAPHEIKFDLHNQLQINRQKLADHNMEQRIKHNDEPRFGNNVKEHIDAQLIGQKSINGQLYPKLVNGDKFVPIRKMVHLDLKGGAYKVKFFNELFAFFNNLGLTGILIEWEDMFPYSGKLASAINGNAYSVADIETILKTAKDHNLEVIPLVQTFGHLEWLLKLEEFKHLREDSRYPQVICFSSEESFELIKMMVDQVAEIHKRFDMKYFHMGADEAFQVGFCNATIKRISSEGGKERAMLWHISRTAEYIKNQHSVTVLAWHDMFGHVSETDLNAYRMTEVLEPVLWSYAEDLEQYLPFSSWLALKPFKKVWGSSAFKGADGPMRYHSNPMHYIKNHESWITQMTRAYKEFDYFQGLIITGWSRYDHFAVLAELLPVNLPTLAMSVETIDSGRPLHGQYSRASEVLRCTAKFEQGYVLGCQFPGRRIYELVNEMYEKQQAFYRYKESDYEFNGWVSKVAEKYGFSSPMYVEKVNGFLDYHANYLERIERELRTELNKIYFEDTVDEFILTYLSDDLELLRGRKAAIQKVLTAQTFPKRPFVKYPHNGGDL
uniref:Beta-N-acetylhexosaminidase n=1 Tax=Panagrolaimus sp. JU765 TaxID=591449 RepID=A0AC34PUU6_9BILA